jgi:hypothetical protein
MSDHVVAFDRGRVCLPFDPAPLIDAWDELRGKAIRQVPDAFSRDEWAYLITFLESKRLWSVFESVFGSRCDAADTGPRLYYPRGTVAVWLPNNVSLLGPLVMILLSLTGNKLRFKAGSRSDDLCAALLDFIDEAGPDPALRDYLDAFVRREVFDHTDPRNAEMASEAQVRIVFGGDAAAQGVESLPHPLHSISLPFTDRRSEAWIDPAAVDEAVLESLIRVFLVYGQAGCTSPSRVILLDADDAAVEAFRARLIDAWPRVVKQPPEANVASANIMARQWAAGEGWQAELAPHASAVIGVGKLDPVDAPLFLPLTGLSVDEAIGQLPKNIQTIGHVLAQPVDDDLLARMARAGVKRFVPLHAMHHFGPVWDGFEFWPQLFECMELQA